MSLFGRKTESPPTPSTALTVAPKPAAAPKASEIEGLVRAAIWGKLSPELARVAGLGNVAELLEWVSGARRLASPDVMALARATGVVDTPETGVDVLRRTLGARMRKRVNFDWLEFPGGGRGEDNLRDFIAGADCLTLPELNLLAQEFYGKHTEVDPVTAMLKSTAPEPTSIGVAPGAYRGGSNVPGLNELALEAARAKLRALEALVATEQAS